jgi:hypothetical protein
VTLTGAQVRAARALLGWTLVDLGYRARVADSTIMRFEGARHPIRPDKVEAMRRTLEAAGVAFEDDGQVRMRDGKV